MLARTLVGPGLPVWSVAFLPDSRTLLTGGADNIIRRWNAATGEPVDPILLETAGDPLAAFAAIAAPRSFAPVSPAIRLAPSRPTAPDRRLPESSAGASRPHPVTIFPKRSSGSISSGRRRRFPDCSRSGRRPIRPAPRCRSSASARSRIAPRWCSSSSARRRNSDRSSQPLFRFVTASSASKTPATYPRTLRSEAWLRLRRPVIFSTTPRRWSRKSGRWNIECERSVVATASRATATNPEINRRFMENSVGSICSVACTTALRPTVTRECGLRHLSRSCF